MHHAIEQQRQEKKVIERLQVQEDGCAKKLASCHKLIEKLRLALFCQQCGHPVPEGTNLAALMSADPDTFPID